MFVRSAGRSRPTPTMQPPISLSLNLERGRSGTRGRFVAGRSVAARPFADAIVIHLFIQIPDYNRLMLTFIAAAALCRRRCVSPWHSCAVAFSNKELRALRRASCDRTQPMVPPPPFLPPADPPANTCRRARLHAADLRRSALLLCIVEFGALVARPINLRRRKSRAP